MKSSVLQYRPAEADNRRLANLCGAVDDNLRQIEEAYDVRIARRADTFSVEGPGPQAKHAVRALEHFYRRADAPPGGSGLGLAIVRSVAERSHASVELLDSPLGGLRVRVSFTRQV